MLQEACIIAGKLGHPEFKASNGWLQSFKLRHNLKQLTVCGKSAEVREETVEVWHERMKGLVIGYSAQDIWNADESGCFYRSLPEKTLAPTAAQCKGGKKSENRVTLTFCVNAAGRKEPPIVIGKSVPPRCFKGQNDQPMPSLIPYYANKSAWMTSEIMDDILL